MQLAKESPIEGRCESCCVRAFVLVRITQRSHVHAPTQIRKRKYHSAHTDMVNNSIHPLKHCFSITEPSHFPTVYVQFVYFPLGPFKLGQDRFLPNPFQLISHE